VDATVHVKEEADADRMAAREHLKEELKGVNPALYGAVSAIFDRDDEEKRAKKEEEEKLKKEGEMKKAEEYRPKTKKPKKVLQKKVRLLHFPAPIVHSD
jgi:hypothetical protein